jgi:hypothetical protein
MVTLLWAVGLERITPKYIYRIFSNIMRTLFTILEGQEVGCILDSRAYLILGRELDFGKMIQPLYMP